MLLWSCQGVLGGCKDIARVLWGVVKYSGWSHRVLLCVLIGLGCYSF